MMNKIVLFVSVVVVLTGCSTQAQRMSECEAQGISRDTCYLAEQNRQSNINAVAEKQALENARNAVK